jgi:L-aminopeptidase/D-esterase-like protein
VIVAKDDTTGGVDVRGGAPGTRETDVLSPTNSVQIVNAITVVWWKRLRARTRRRA